MIGNTSVVLSLLLLCVVFVLVQSSPTQKNVGAGLPTLNRQKRTFGLNFFGPRDWSQFRQVWRLPNFPTMPSVSNYFDDEDLHENFRKRILTLENGQKRIVNFLRKIEADKNANPCGGHSSTQRLERLPTPVAESANLPASTTSSNVPEIAQQPQTTPTTTTSTSTSTTTSADDSVVKFPQEQQVTTRTTTIATRLQEEQKAEAQSDASAESKKSSQESSDKSTEAELTVPTTTIMEEFGGEGETTPVNNDESIEENEVFV